MIHNRSRLRLLYFFQSLDHVGNLELHTQFSDSYRVVSYLIEEVVVYSTPRSLAASQHARKGSQPILDPSHLKPFQHDL